MINPQNLPPIKSSFRKRKIPCQGICCDSAYTTDRFFFGFASLVFLGLVAIIINSTHTLNRKGIFLLIIGTFAALFFLLSIYTLVDRWVKRRQKGMALALPVSIVGTDITRKADKPRKAHWWQKTPQTPFVMYPFLFLVFIVAMIYSGATQNVPPLQIGDYDRGYYDYTATYGSALCTDTVNELAISSVITQNVTVYVDERFIGTFNIHQYQPFVLADFNCVTGLVNRCFHQGTFSYGAKVTLITQQGVRRDQRLKCLFRNTISI